MFTVRALLGLCILGITVSAFSDDQDEAVMRGQYLAIAGDCAGCHTREEGDDYAVTN